MTLLSPRIVNNVSYVRGFNHESDFSWQAQYLVDLECYFSWQAQHFVKFWEIAGARNVVFFHTKCASKIGSDYPRIMFESSLYWRKQFRDFSPVLFKSEFRGRRSIW